METSILADPTALWILALDLGTFLILAFQCLRCIGSHRWKIVLRECGSHARAMMRIAWSRLRKPQDAEGLQVSAKFHEALVNLMKTGCRLMALALFLRLIAIQGPLLMQKEHQLQLSLDISNMISYPLCCLIVLCPKVLTPRTLDSWYLVMQTLCVFPLLFTEPQDVVNVSLITAFPRMLCGIGARTCFLPILGNLVNCGVAIYQAQEDADGGGGAGGLAQTAELCMVLCGILSMRQGLYENVLMNTRLKSRSIDLEAVSQLLLGFCDAVVEIDGSLKLTEDSRQLSTLLLHNQGEGMTGEGLAGRDFLSFFCQEDRQRIKESLSESGGQHTLALHVRMLDCLGSNLQVEILHCRFENAKGQSCCLVGIREFQDVGHAALAPLPFELSDVDGRTGVLLFDAESMEIIDVTNFERFTDQNLQGTSLQQLQAGPGGSLDEILLAIQDAVNDAYEKGKEKVGPIDLEELELFSTHLRGTLTLQHDLMLKTLVGTLSLEPKSKLTQQNVAKLEKFAQKKRESKRKRSRGSKGSQGSRSSGDSQLSGSILALRKKNCSL